MTRRPDGFPEPAKPVAEMTPEEKQQFARDIRRWSRDGQIRSGKKKPRTMRETELFLEGAEQRFGRRQARSDRLTDGEQ